MKTLFVLSKILGNANFSKNILETVMLISDIDPTIFYFEYSDYNKKTPKYLLKNYRSSYITRAKINENGIKNDFDLIFFQSIHLTLCFKDWIDQTPAIVSHDQTPASSFELIKLEQNTFQTDILCSLKNILNHIIYRSVLKKIKVFMPWTHYCANSLVQHYKVSSDKIIISPGYVNIKKSMLNSIVRDFSKKELLFIGNEFKRKGGEILLEIFQHLDTTYHLTIVTNDKIVDSIELPVNISLLKGINTLDQLIPVYASATLFVFPTKREQMGLVLMEAVATGLPSIATDVGGVSEIIKHNQTGILMPYSSTAKEWAETIEKIYKQQNWLSTTSEYTKSFWPKYFSQKTYTELLTSAFKMAINRH